MYREWSLSETLTAENGEFKHEIPDEFFMGSDEYSDLEIDDDTMDHIANNMELPIYNGIFEFLGFFLDDEDQGEDRGIRKQIPIMQQGEELPDSLSKKERDMRISVRANNKSPMFLPVILDDCFKLSKTSFMNSLCKKAEASINKFKPLSKEKDLSRTKSSRSFNRNKISTTNTTIARRQSLTKQTRLKKEQRSTNNAHTNVANEKKKVVVRSKAIEVPVHPPQRRIKLDLDEAMKKRILEGKKLREEYEQMYEINKANRLRIFF